MSAEKLIEELESRGLVSDRVIVKLREKLSEAERPLSAKAIAKFLVEKQHLTQRQATEVLGSLLRSGVDVDPAVAREPAEAEGVHEFEPIDALPSVEDDPESSSIFAPYLSGIQRPSTAMESSDELGLAPDSDAPVEVVPPAERAKPAAVTETPAVTGETKARKRDRRREAEQPRRDEPVELPATDEIRPSKRSTRRLGTKASDEPPKRDRKKKPVKHSNHWDSPLILWGGGGLLLLLIAGATIYWLLNWETGDEKLRLAQEAVNAGSYTQAITHYQEFLDRFPRHRDRSVARVQLAMARLRKAVEASDNADALKTAQAELEEIQNEEKFDEAHAELAALLPRIALGLATEAEAAKAPDAAVPLVEQSKAALALTNNTKYVPKSLRDEAELDEVRETLGRVQRRQQSQQDLEQAIAAMQNAIASGDTRAAYAEHVKFVKQHPELAADAGLAEMVQKTTAAEQAAIHLVSEEQAAATTERPTPWVASLAVAHRRVKPSANPTVPGPGTAVVRIDGAAYGLDAATGRLLWRRHVGHSRTAWPVSIGPDVIVADAARNELLRLEAATGRLIWRQAIGEPFAAPLVVGERAFVAAKSGRLFVVDLKSGTRAGYLQFAQPLRVTPTADRNGERIYFPGDHSTLYSISLADLSCLGVYYLGHAEGSISVSPAAVADKVALLENDGVETSRLRLMSIGEQGAIAGQVAERRLTGLASAPPFVAGRRAIVITDRGQIEVYEIASGQGENAMTLVATRAASGSQPVVRHAALAGRNIWIGDTQLTKFSILPTGNRLPVESIENNFTGATFDHPLALFGSTLVHVRRAKGRAGAVVAATDTAQGRTLWETDLAMPPAGPPIVEDSGKALAAANAEGYVFRFDEAAIRARVQDEPLGGQSQSTPGPALTTAVDLGQGRAAFCAPGADRLLLYNPALGDRAANWIQLESPLACAVTALGDGFIAPLKVGQVFYLSSADGAKLATPFQPVLQPHTTWDYKPAGVVAGESSRFTIADGHNKIYVVALVDKPLPHLEAVAETETGQYPIESPVIVMGETATAVAGSTHLVRFQLPSLQPAGESNLPAPVVWGPFRVGDSLLLATADGQLMAFSAAGEVIWHAPFEHGDLTGAPLVLEDSVLVAYRKGILERRALADGKMLAASDIEQPLAAGPVAFQQRLVLAANDGTMLVVDQP